MHSVTLTSNPEANKIPQHSDPTSAGEKENYSHLSFHLLQLDCPAVIAAIFVSGIGGTFQYGFSVSVMTSPSAVSTQISPGYEKRT